MTQLSQGSLVASRFEILGTAGVGGMSTVYKARDRFSGEIVALKLLETHGTDPNEALRFVSEAQVLASLAHPGIVSYITHGLSTTGQRFLAMEWLAGEDLASRILRGPLSAHDAILLLLKATDALAFAHQHGIIHRDIKPSNFFLPGGDLARLKLLDFGIARRRAQTGPLTQTGVLIGTPEYMSPEQVRGVRDLTPATDLFSLGCVFYECLTGESPFVSEHIAAVLVRILYEEPTPVEQRRTNIPAELTAVLRQMLQKDPAKRFVDASALLPAVLKITALGELPMALTVVQGSPGVTSFAETEQALCCMVVASEPATTAENPDPAAAERRRSLLLSLGQLAVQAEFVVGDSLVVTVPQSESVTDQVALAARAALLIKSRWPAADVAVATGRGFAHGLMPVGEVAERAARLLASRPRDGVEETTGTISGIWLDPLSRRLLGPRFSVVMKADTALLVGEEKDVDASRPLLGKPTPCVGRDAELIMIEAQLASCIDNSESRALLITASPGVGKSRLRHEFLRRISKREEPVTILLGRGDLVGAGAPYGILGEAIRRLCGLSGSEPLAERQQRLAERIGRHLGDAERERAVLFICELSGAAYTQESPALRAARLDPKQMSDCISQAIMTWLRAECQAAPVVLVLDDLQWGDALTVGLCIEALARLRNAPLLLAAFARPEVREIFPKFSEAPGIQEIALRGLSKKACERLVHQVLGARVKPEAIARIVEHCAGNALFLEELIRSLDDGQHDENKATPDTVVAMLQARIGRFETGPRRVILAAAVFGQTFWAGGVGAMIGLPKHSASLDAWLSRLLSAEVIVRHPISRFADEVEYGFRHALVRDAAYSLLVESDLLTGHLRAAEFLDAAGEHDAALVAAHYQRGNAKARAAPLYAKAGAEAARLHLHSAARQHYAAAIAALEDLPDDPDLRRLHAEVLTKQTLVSLISATTEQNLHRLAIAEAMLARNLIRDSAQLDPADELLMARVQYTMGRVYYYGGRHAEAIRCYQRSLPVGQRFNDPELSAMPSAVIGMALMTQGHMGQAREYLRNAIEPLKLIGNDFEQHRAQAYLGTVLAAVGKYREGIHELRQAEAWAQDNERGLLVTIARILRALAHRSGMNWPDMLECISGVGDAALNQGEKLYAIFGWSLEAWAVLHLGRTADAAVLRGRAKVLEAELGGKHAISHWFTASDGEAALIRGNPELALGIAQSLVEISAAAGLPKTWGMGERLWGMALSLLGGSLPEVDSHMTESLRVLALGELTIEAAQTQLCWGQLLRQRGEDGLAAPHLATAIVAFEEAGCDYAAATARHLVGL